MLSDANVRITWTKSGTPSSPCFLMISEKKHYILSDSQMSTGLILTIKMLEKHTSVSTTMHNAEMLNVILQSVIQIKLIRQYRT